MVLANDITKMRSKQGEKKLKTKPNSIKGGLIWSFGERITAQLVTTVVSIVLARLLDPEHYGIVAIVIIFINLCNVFVTSGFGNAIVQQQKASSIDFNTAFALSMTISLLLYFLLFLVSPLIERYYAMDDLAIVLRVMALRLPLAALNSIQQAYIQRQMAFKSFFIATLFGTVVSGIVGVLLAFHGYGVWALVAQYLTNTTVDTIALWFICGWKPRFQYSRTSAKRIVSFGWRLLASELVATLEGDIRTLIVGKVFGSSDLAYYEEGKKYPGLVVTNINAAISKVMLPAYSKQQENLLELKNTLRKTIRLGVYILAPVMVGFMVVSNGFVSIILTEKWILAVPYIRIFCICYFTRPLETSCRQAILGIGKSDIIFRIMLIVNIFALSTVIIAVFAFKSVFLIAIGSLLTTVLSVVCYGYYANRLLGYRIKEQIGDIAQTFMMCAFMGICVKCVELIGCTTMMTLIIQILVGIFVYVLLSKTTKNDSFNYLLNIIKKIVHKDSQLSNM
ncbi:MAG: lipopolysaccharide biosynthesis protein [Clostridia bacterium]|nr:lipopolysaccharide biosynthesis protein [Clostridia bacterium]